jgi:hypothetical protein
LSSGWLLVQAAKAKAHNRIIADFFIVLILNMVAKIKKSTNHNTIPASGLTSISFRFLNFLAMPFL